MYNLYTQGMNFCINANTFNKYSLNTQKNKTNLLLRPNF